MEYLSEIKEIVSSYDTIREGLLELERSTKALESRRAELDMALDANRKREAALIDKITKKTVLSNEKHVKNIHNAQKDKKKINYIDKML